MHSAVWGKFTLVHLQSPQDASLQPHLMSSLHAFEASGRVVQVGFHPSEDRCHPHSAALGRSWIETNVWPETWPAWCAVQVQLGLAVYSRCFWYPAKSWTAVTCWHLHVRLFGYTLKPGAVPVPWVAHRTALPAVLLRCAKLCLPQDSTSMLERQSSCPFPRKMIWCHIW